MRSHRLKKIVERLKLLEIRIVPRPELLHGTIGLVRRTVDPSDDGTQRGVVIHGPKSEGQVDKPITKFRS